MSAPTSSARFVDQVMRGVERQERRLPRVAAALLALALVLAVPAVVVLRAGSAVRVVVDLGLALVNEVLGAVADNPIFWIGVGVTALWLGWLLVLALGGRR